MCPYVQKDFWIRTLIKQLLTKYQIFMKLPQISHIQKNRTFKSIIRKKTNQLLLPYKFYSRDM